MSVGERETTESIEPIPRVAPSASPTRSGHKLWKIARSRYGIVDESDDEVGGARGRRASATEVETAQDGRRRRRASSDYESYLRPILDRMPVKPERVSSVNGPLMNVTRIDDKTLDVTMTTSFRAHFAENLTALGERARALALPDSEGNDSSSSWSGAGVSISEVDAGEFVPGRGGRYSVMTPADSWNASDAGTNGRQSPALGWYEDGAGAAEALRDEFLINPEDVRLQERIAVGGFAEVFRGTWQGTVVAVKQLLERTTEVQSKLKQEVEVLAKLRHPNLLLFMGYCVDPPLICTEFMRRGSLHTILKSGQVLEPERNHAIAIAVARGMSYLHSRSPPILHLDLKSPNILVDEKWRVKIADFGLARMRQATQVSAKSEFHGTPEWMAPEMLRAEAYDERADSYSFGVVLWELLTARKPWDDLHPMQVVAVVGYSERRLELPPDATVVEDRFTSSIASLFVRCTEKTPTSRPSFTTILTQLETTRADARVARDASRSASLSREQEKDTKVANLGVQLEYLDVSGTTEANPERRAT